MRILGFDIQKSNKAKKTAGISTSPQFKPYPAQGWMTSWFQDYYLRKVSGDFYEILREGIPIIDSAIRRLISLNGTIRIIGDKGSLVRELEDFSLNVPVNDKQKGIHAFLENASNETFEQGFALAEFIATKDLKDIAGLRVADSKQIVFRKNAEGKAEEWYRYPGKIPTRTYNKPESIVEQILTATYNQTIWINGAYEEKLNPENKLYFSINNENTDPYGVSIMRSMEFVAKILMTMQNSIGHVWERFGDPSFHIKYKTTKRDLAGDDVEKRRQKIQTDFDSALRSKRAGKSADFVTAVNADADVSIEVIGHDNQILQLDVPARHVLEQIISKTNLPAWMLSIYWSTTERMATLEVESALQDAKIRQLAMVPEFIRLFSTMLKLRGRSWKNITMSIDKPGDWGFVFETPNLRDLVAQAQARFLNAQADMMQSGINTNNTQTNVAVGGASVEIQGMKFPTVVSRQCGCSDSHNHKELSRPTAWPELDSLEVEYEDGLKGDWKGLQERVFEILGLEQSKEPRNTQTKEDGSDTGGGFGFSDDQRDEIMKSLKDLLGKYDWKDSDSPVRYYYGQSYSLGLIQAAVILGKDRPLLDIIKNREIFDEIAKNGFKLVKNNATRAIVDKIIPSIEAQVAAGSNPRHVAERLKRLFGDKNADWERLARSELSLAAENAKIDEWKEWGVDTGRAVIPVADTHPRCRCSNSVKDVDGKLVIKFVPAPDACPICMALAQ